MVARLKVGTEIGSATVMWVRQLDGINRDARWYGNINVESGIAKRAVMKREG